MEFEYMEFDETLSNTQTVARMMSYLGYEVERDIDMPIIRVTDEYVGHAADWRLVNGRISAITMYAGRYESSLWHELCHHHQPVLRQGAGLIHTTVKTVVWMRPHMRPIRWSVKLAPLACWQ